MPRIARVGKALCSHHITANAALQRCLLLTHPQPFLKSILPVERALPFRKASSGLRDLSREKVRQDHGSIF